MIALLLFIAAPLWALRKDEAMMSPVELIRLRGYPAQEHRVATKDGYLLVLHRIPGDRKGCRGGRPVLLQHGLLLSSFDFLSPARNQSLSYSLADAGYDVWIANSRGNIYSNKHKQFNITDPRFWNFSWDDMGRFDYPAIISYILKRSRSKKMYVVGHSQGALSFLISTTVAPSIRKKVLHFFGLAPAIGTQSVGVNLARIVTSLPPEILLISKRADLSSSQAGLSLDSLTAPVFFPFCSDPAMKNLCLGIIAATGPMDQLDKSRLPLLLSHFPGGTSVKLVLHWLQLAAKANATAFDYGPEGNMAAYGTVAAPVYDFSRYRVPTTLFFSPADTLQALSVIPQCAIVRARNLTGFGHFDFLWGTRARKEVHNKIIKEMKRIEGR